MVLTFIMLVNHEDSSINEDSAQFPRHLKGSDKQRSVKGRKERRAEKSRKTTDARRWGRQTMQTPRFPFLGLQPSRLSTASALRQFTYNG